MDLVVVTYGPDLRLLRHFLASCDLYYKESERIYVVASTLDRSALEGMELSTRTRLVFREDFPELAESTPFSQQLYLKLISYRIVETEYFCVMDSDFLFVKPTQNEDFFYENKPLWFYRPWVDGEPPLRWRAGSEKMVASQINYNYGDISQWVFKRSIAEDFTRVFDPKIVLNKSTISEFLVYGWFIHQKYPDSYSFVLQDGDVQPIVEKINQIPPTYLHLDPACAYADYRDSNCVVFWSHWDLAERKMAEFLEDSQREHFGRVVRRAARTALPTLATPESIASGDYNRLAGVDADGWVLEEASLGVAVPAGAEAIDVGVMVPGRPDGTDWSLELFGTLGEPDDDVRVVLPPGFQVVRVPVQPALGETRYVLRLRFGRGFRDPANADGREFRAKLTSLSYWRPEPVPA